MDKSEYRAKLDQITALFNAGDYENAQTIVDEVDWRRVKSARTLCMVSEIYEENDRLPDSRKILELAYKRALVKTVAYRLVEVCLKLKDVDAAQDYYDDFADLAPMDNSKYILKYKIHRAKGDSLDQQIKALEDYKEREYTEPWAYELAKLYSQAEKKDACVDACDDLILWFSEGPYVLKAMELKKKYVPLSPSQQEKYKKELSAKEVKATVPSFLTQTVQDKKYINKTAKETVQNIVQSEKSISPSNDEGERNILVTEDEISVISAEEAIEKMDAAASSTVQAENSIKLPFGKIPAGKSIPAFEPSRMQSQLVDSIRNVFAGINNKGTVQLDNQASVMEESYEEPYQEDMTGYEIKELEPEIAVKENMPASEVVLSVLSSEEIKKEDQLEDQLENQIEKQIANQTEDQIKGQMSFDDFAKKESEFDFEALFAETTSALAQELASGIFEQEKVVNTEEEADKVVEEEIARIVAEEAKSKVEDQTDAASLEQIALEQISSEQISSEQIASGTIDNQAKVQIENQIKDETEEQIEKQIEDQVEKQNDNQNENQIKERHLGTELESVFISEDTVLGKEDKAEDHIVLESITLALDEEEAEEDLTKKIINETKKEEIKKESVTLKSAYESNVVQDELITDPEQIVLSEESKTELTYLPLEPRPLTAEEKEIFTYFSRIPGLGEQITVALSDVHNNAGDKTSKSGNFLVIGRQGSGKTRLYESMVLAICKDLGMDAAKNAKIIAREFNHKDPAAVVAKLAGGFLAIEGAGELSDEAAEKLAQAMEFRTDSLVVVLEDEKDDLMRMLEKHPRLAEKFTTTIKIPVFTNDELVSFARIYALDQGYRIDEMGVLALYTKIGDNQKDAEPITVGKVKEMMDEAMLKANKGHRKLSRRFSKNAVDEENRIILFEKDFE